MFEAGERVVCVDDGPETWLDPETGKRWSEASGLVSGRIYVVAQMFPKGLRYEWPDGSWMVFRVDAVDVGEGRADRCGLRYFSAQRFRKINGLDISEGLATVKALCAPADGRVAA